MVLDEVHSYDLYTGTLVDTLVRRLRDLGATVVILSATLTAARRQQLLGLPPPAPASTAAPDTTAAVTLPSEPYPLISALRDGDRGLITVPVERGAVQTVSIGFDSPAALSALAVEHAERGECVLWIRNTVDTAQETWRQLRSAVRTGGPEVGLLHSRFPAFRREQLEAAWIDALGKDPSQRPAAGCILVSTQIAEQSVDIDADLLLTDLAPTDMLLQRLGRLWRHTRVRPPGATHQAWIAAPSLSACELRSATSAELIEALSVSAKVYAPYILVRTLAVWQGRCTIDLPTAIRPLIESTYAEFDWEPDAWRELRSRLTSQREKMVRQALTNTNPWQLQLDDTEDVQTRWNGLPTALVLPLTDIRQEGRYSVRCQLLDGRTCELRVDSWDYAAARAVHANLVKVPRWTVRDLLQAPPAWLSTYVHEPVVACRLAVDGRLLTLPDLAETPLEYSPDIGMVIRRDTAPARQTWAAHTEDDDEFDE